jgi:hypothetical protein
MKNILILFVASMIAISCQTGPTRLGEAFTEQTPKTVDGLVAELREKGELKDVQLAGKIDKNCMEKGCWLSMMSSDGAELVMTFKEEKFTIPINSEGRQIVVIGDARMTQDSVEGKLETNYEFESRGLVFK